MNANHILIVHCDPSVRRLLDSMLQTMNLRIDEADCDRVAVRMLDQQPYDALIACVTPDDPDALELLSYTRRKHPNTPVVLLFPNLQNDRVREAMAWGATSVLRFPLPATHLRAAVSQALGLTGEDAVGAGPAVGMPAMPVPAFTFRPAAAPPADMSKLVEIDAATLRNGLDLPQTRHEGNGSAAGPALQLEPIVGECPCFRQVVELATRIAPMRAPVLILGDRGTGKTRLGHLLHQQGLHPAGPLVEIDCAAADIDIEAELFGQAATAKGPARPGAIARAQGGTLLIDQVGSLPAGLQQKLLRIMQDGVYEFPGTGQRQRLDVRFVFLSREDLSALVARDQFRADLYYTLSALTLKLPPLEHRGDDIIRLAEAVLDRCARRTGRPVVGLSGDAIEMLYHHGWSGNIKELEAVIERAFESCRGPRIESRHLELGRRDSLLSRLSVPGRQTSRGAKQILPLKEALEEPERQLILEALEALNWNRQETARVLDINRTTLYKKMKKYGLLFDEPVWAN